ncbi:MAG: dihydroorotase [Candidatus Methylumidiphilus alinenensis]|uniref:Dihydroorotase n=1 Tax=Candidatus Methylumidiphilus alinenensis TaxID=2202197 RepID=A0A2W4R0H0_9GAMM|nr:MAG: dihydroorotase [Candidatus Methylumidiphilus alinenensis]
MIGEKIIIRGGRVIDPANGVDASVSVCIADGKIEAVGDVPKGFAANQEIDAQGQIVCPGFVDLCVRLREPGQEHKATIASETAAAAAAGVTTLCCPPDTRRVIDTPALVNLLRERADGAGKARVIPIGALTRGLLGKELCSMMALKGAGCFAVSNAYAPMENLLVLRRALEYAANCGLLVIVRPEEPALRNRGCAHDGAVSSRLGLPVIPYSAETVAVAQTLVLAEQTQARVHFGQLSCARAVAMIAEAQSRGVKVSADVAIHQLHLTEHAVDGFDANAHVNPPFRALADRDALREGLAAGILQAICSDHQPHDPNAKLDAFPATEPGISSLETLLPLALQLVESGVLDLSSAIARLAHGPATIMGLDAGTLSVGAKADICLFDPSLEWTASGTDWLSRGVNSPFYGSAFKGRVTKTLLGGRVVHSL